VSRSIADGDQIGFALRLSLRRPGYAKAFSLTTRTGRTPAEQRLSDIQRPPWS
jgi:hypothetical protein